MTDLLNIIYQDDDLVVVNKPSGLLAAPGRGADKLDSVTERLKAQFPQAPNYPAVHRLDMDTSGLMLLSLNAEAHKKLSRQFQEREVHKQYVAVLEGSIAGDYGKIELPFRLDVDNRPHQIYDPIHGKTGITHWEVLQRNATTTRVLFTPITGRTHQLRVHSAHEKGLGTPIVGDTLYGTGTEHGKLQLHASSLSFTHPSSGEKVQLESSPLF